MEPFAGRAARLPARGVGLVYLPKLRPLIQAEAGLIDVLEVEPQTLWLQAEGTAESYRVDSTRLSPLRALAIDTIFHGVGFPVGGVRTPSAAQMPPLLAMIDTLAPSWMSEHLAFNRICDPDGGVRQTGFLLPPRQTPAGVAAAVRSVRSIADRLPVPFAVENGTSYLAVRADEMSDGEFLAAVAEEADCGILLDLHNAWTNERNGRQRLDDFLAQIPLDRVLEVHLAGGMEYRGYWLDAHCGEIPSALLDIAQDVIPRLPGLKALVFEVTDSFVGIVDFPTIVRQLERLHDLWSLRRPASPPRVDGRHVRRKADVQTESPGPGAWEQALGGLVIGRSLSDPLAAEITADPGLQVFRHLVAEFRASTVVGTLPYASRLLLLALGVDRFNEVLGGFWAQSPPESFGSRDARRFAGFVSSLRLDVPLLPELLAYDVAVIDALTEGASRLVRFSRDPVAMFAALADHRMPTAASSGDFAAHVTAAGIQLLQPGEQDVVGGAQAPRAPVPASRA